MDVYTRCVESLGLFKQALGPLQPVLVESFVEDVVLGRGDIESRWEALEEEWRTAREHANLFEEALSMQEFKGGWEERKRAEREALEHLLRQNDYIKDDGIWRKENHAISLDQKKGVDWMTALSQDRAFISLLSELGPIPKSLERNGLNYKVIESGGSMALAVMHPDGAVYLIRDLSDMEGRDGEQIGIDWDAAEREVSEEEKDRREAYRRFREEQMRVRVSEWRESVKKEVITPLLRWGDGDLEKCTDKVMDDAILSRILKLYMDRESLSRYLILSLLQSLRPPSIKRGRKPLLDTILRSAKELIGQREQFIAPSSPV